MKKVSKPVLFTLIFAVGMILYLYVFSGKKLPPAPGPKVQPGQMAAVPQQGAAQVLAGAQNVLAGMQRPALSVEDTRMREEAYAQLKDINWVRDPFAFPRNIEARRDEQQSKGSAKLVAIIEGKKGRYAILDNEVVGKGDMVGKERVADIAENKIVLVRDGVKRVVTIEEAPATNVEIKVKKRGSK